jgi:hypothetical protein
VERDLNKLEVKSKIAKKKVKEEAWEVFGCVWAVVN